MSPRVWAALGTAAAAAVFACARPYPPPGGDPDQQPPGVVSITPEPLTVGVARDARIVIRFDERISERGVEEAVLVSPLTSELQVDRGRSELRVSLRGGWEPGRIYHVVIQPVIQDLFQNTIEQPLEIVFSTGPEIPRTALAGLVQDRVTRSAAAGIWVLAVRESDSVSYAATTDSAGLFALRYLPAGTYRIRAFQDRNRDRDASFREEQDSASVRLAEGDTAVVSLALLLPDTTPAHVIRAEAPDSMQVRVHLDDHVDPTEGIGEVTASLRLLPDSSEWPIARILFPHEYEAEQRALRAAADSARADSMRVDSAAVDSLRAAGIARADTLAPDAPRRAAGPRAPGPPEAEAAPDSVAEPLPVRELVIVPGAPLRPASRYVVELARIVNINGLAGGGGSAEFAAPEPPPPDTAAPGPARDTIPPDTMQPPQGHRR
ncbi:MAG TPA: Ig-like domain-containing protein [Longimicrobiales bacterium]